MIYFFKNTTTHVFYYLYTNNVYFLNTFLLLSYTFLSNKNYNHNFFFCYKNIWNKHIHFFKYNYRAPFMNTNFINFFLFKTRVNSCLNYFIKIDCITRVRNNKNLIIKNSSFLLFIFNFNFTFFLLLNKSFSIFLNNVNSLSVQFFNNKKINKIKSIYNLLRIVKNKNLITFNLLLI